MRRLAVSALVWVSIGCSTGAHVAVQEAHREPVAAKDLREALAAHPLLGATPVAEAASTPGVVPRIGSSLTPAVMRFVEPAISPSEWARATDGSRLKVATERATRLRALASNEQLQSAYQVRIGAESRLSQSLGLRRLVEQVEGFAAVEGNPADGSLLPTAASVQGRVVAADVDVEQVDFESLAFDAMEQVTRTFHDARYQAQVVSVMAKRLEFAKRLVAAARARFAINGSSGADVARAEMTEQEAQRDLSAARVEKNALERKLGALLGSEEETVAGEPRPRSRLPRLSDVRAAARSQSLAVRAASARLARGQAMLAMSELETIPDRRPNGPMVEEGSPSMVPGLSYGIEAPWLVELRARVLALEHTLASARVTSHAAAEMAHSKLTDALRRARLYRRELLPRASRVLETLQLQYATSRATYVELDDALSEWLRAGLGHHEALRDVAVATAELEAILGMPLSAIPGDSNNRAPE